VKIVAVYLSQTRPLIEQGFRCLDGGRSQREAHGLEFSADDGQGLAPVGFHQQQRLLDLFAGPNVMVECLTSLLRIREVQFQISARTPAIVTEVSVVFLSQSRQMPGQYLKLQHDRFLPLPFKFIIHLSLLHSTLYSLQVTEKASLNKQVTQYI
jgi:hypothetical protein